MSRLILSRLQPRARCLELFRRSVTLQQPIRLYTDQTLLARAHKALTDSDLEEAKRLFRQLSTTQSATIDTLYNLGVVEWLTKKPEAAIQCWQSALSKESDDKATQSDCHTNLANYFLLVKPDLSQALKHLKAASELTPDDGEIRHNYGMALEKDGQLELALENYLRAEELGIKRDIETLIRNAGAKLLKRNAELPPTKEELDAVKDDIGPTPTQVDYGPSGNGR